VKRALVFVVASSFYVSACSASKDVEIADAPADAAPPSSSGGPPSSSGGVDAAPADSAPPDAGPTAFTLTSTAFAEGGKIPDDNACTGDNTSPPLAWAGAPAEAKSFAVVFTDKSNGLVHSVIYDIPATLSALPANVAKAYQPANVPGAKQTRAYDNRTFGYLGPCPPNQHTYELALHALDVATLPETSMATTRAQAVPKITEHSIATAKLTGTYEKP